MQDKCQRSNERRQKLGASRSTSSVTIHHTWKVYSTAQQEQMFVLSCLNTDTKLPNFTNGLTFWGAKVTPRVI